MTFTMNIHNCFMFTWYHTALPANNKKLKKMKICCYFLRVPVDDSRRKTVLYTSHHIYYMDITEKSEFPEDNETHKVECAKRTARQLKSNSE